VLEKKINNYPNLDAAEKLELEGYLTRSYGSPTTFNALFADKISTLLEAGRGRDKNLYACCEKLIPFSLHSIFYAMKYPKIQI
jgi:hypothetical protein